jgi:hypothetical protein
MNTTTADFALEQPAPAGGVTATGVGSNVLLGSFLFMITLPENKHITKRYTLAEIKEQMEAGEYSAELLLQHLCAHTNDMQAALGSSVEFLRDLRGEWRWKDGAGERNSRDFLELEKCIETVSSLLPNASGDPSRPSGPEHGS